MSYIFRWLHERINAHSIGMVLQWLMPDEIRAPTATPTPILYFPFAIHFIPRSEHHFLYVVL